jgi:serine/threonine-protein kinase
MPLRLGARFGRYELADLLGKGGMGEVYSAYDSILHRKVALKVLTAPGGGFSGSDSPPSSGGATRILREARAAAGITHPNAVAIYDVGEVDGLPFLAMELVMGRTLRAFVGDPTVPLGRRIRWIADVARALGAAHQLGLVHRDIKPENVMVRDDGFVKVLDFGIARRALTPEDRPAPRMEDLAALGMFAGTSGTLTAEGVIVGTPMYMAPEQVRGEVLDGRTDQFAWGVLAHELLTGKLPWDGEGMAIISQILSKAVPPLTEKSREIPGPVDLVVRKALSKVPASRFATMEAVADELEPFAFTVGTTGRERIQLPVREMELAATEQIAISSGDVGAQSAAAALTQGQTVRKARGRSVAAVSAIVAAIAVGGVLGARALTGSRSARTASVDAGPLDVPSQMSSNPDATAAYRAGMQGLRDGSMSAALNQFTRAIELDPLFAAAHLRLALTKLLDVDAQGITSADLQGAHASQASLGTHDRALLDAFEHMARVPPDFKESERLLGAAGQKYPNDADFPFQRAVVLDYAEQPAEAAKALDVSIARDPTFALAWRMMAQLRIELDDAAGATKSFDECLKVSPGATTCLGDLARIQANEGKCEELVRTSRQLSALMPDAYQPYMYLAQGLLGSGAPADAARAALQQMREHLPAAKRPSSQLFSDAALSVLAGDFLGAERKYYECDRMPDARGDDVLKCEIAYSRVLIDLEIGRSAQARQVADAYLRQREGLALSARGYQCPLIMEAAKLAGGETTRAAFGEVRRKWLTQNPDAPPVDRWLLAYALPTASREDADAALAAKPDTRPLFNLLALYPTSAEPVGRVYALSGRLDEAIDYLEPASASCQLLQGRHIIFSSWATLELGHALEQRGDKAAACAAYQRVLARWGKALPPSKTATGALERARALDCAP